MRKAFLLMFLVALYSMQGKSIAKWYTSMGEFAIELREDLAPITTANFIDLEQERKR